MADNKHPITTNLFSFKTFRSPDKIDFNKRDEYFIHHPDVTRSLFNKCPIRNEDGVAHDRLKVFMASFKPAESYREVREINPVVYDYSCLLMQQRKNDSSRKQLNAELPKPLSVDETFKVWDELFIQTATQKSKTARQACIQLIIAHHYLKNNDDLELKDISKLVVVIPNTVIECFKPWRFSGCDGQLFGVHNLGIQEYRRVEQTLCCYVPGEVSHIENIMAREYKEKSTRNLLRTEYTSEYTSETEVENINDTTTTERHELSSEVAKELQKDKSFNVSGSVSVSKGSDKLGRFSANASTGYNSSSSSAQSNTEAKNYAKEITERALERVVQKTTEKRTYRMIKEFEENNKHGFDNRGDDAKHVTGVYRWVDKVYDNQLVNYGRRLLFEISVPSPAAFYKKAMLWKAKQGESVSTNNTLTPPKTLIELGINAWSDVTNESIGSAMDEYGVSIESYKEEILFKDVAFKEETDHHHATKTNIEDAIEIPQNFVADKIDGIGSFEHRGNSNTKAYLRLNIANAQIHRGDYNSNQRQTDNFNINLTLNPKAIGSIPVSVSYRKVFEYSGSFRVRFVSDPALYRDWQEETLQFLQESYQKKLDAYNEELKLQQVAKETESMRQEDDGISNPAQNRLIEERELKRLCIEMMSKPYCYRIGKSFNECKTYKCESSCGEIENVVPEVIQNEELESYAEFIKFFETAFHWEILSYIFYPYYYNSKCEWSELLQTKSDDPIFQAFLQSGMAKILVPVRPQYEKAVMWYIETGEIYTDENLVPETDDDRYLSLLKDLENQEEIRVEGGWKTRVPSALTIIQGKSTYFEDEKGLPCCDDESEIFGSNDQVLNGLNPE